MKIDGPSGTQKAGATKKTGSKGTSGTSFGGLLGSDEASETAHAAASNVIARVDVLLAAQGSEDPAERASRGRMLQRSDNVLVQLDKIRLGMLTGTLTVGNLLDIADVVASHRERIGDPQLAGLLDEIDLRAQSEIAKMKMALEATNPL